MQAPPQPPPDPAAVAQQLSRRAAPRKTPRQLKALASALSGIVLLALLATGALWWWAGTDGSLATALRWVARYQPLASEGVSGSLRAGGQVKLLSWRQNGLTVEADNVTLAWQPWSLLQGTLKLEKIAAAALRINDQRPPSPEPSLPPRAINLPLRVGLDAFSIGKLQWLGSPSLEVTGIAGNYSFDGLQHVLTLESASFASGRYQGRATLGSAQPLHLNSVVSGTLDAPVPGRAATLPLSFIATADGPLTELSLKVVLQMRGVNPTLRTGDALPQATASARIMPWAAQPVPQADATFKALDLALLWPEAPQTQLTGEAQIRPAQEVGGPTGNSSGSESGKPGIAAWALQTQFVNDLPGPWDRHRLPLQILQAAGEWRAGTAVIRTLKAGIGGGELVASGEWLGSTAPISPRAPGTSTLNSSTSTANTALQQDWTLKAAFHNINPAALHTRLAGLPVDGRAAVRSRGAAIAFDTSMQSISATAKRAPVRTAGQGTDAPAQLRLRDLNATGSWNSSQAGGTLVLSALRLRTDDAELGGSLEVQPAALGGKGRLTLSAPGLNAQLQGELRRTTGSGTFALQTRDAQQAMRWLQRLPGLPVALQTTSAAGQAVLKLDWQDGWQDPALQARLDVPSLDWRSAKASKTFWASGSSQAPVSLEAMLPNPPRAAGHSSDSAKSQTGATGETNLLRLRAVEATVLGKLSQAQLMVRGRLEADERRYGLQLSAEVERISAARGGTLEQWTNSIWQSVVRQFTVSIADPALGSGTWSASTRGSVSLRWTPTPAGRALEVGSGEAVLNAPPRAANAPVATLTTAPSQAFVQWQPIRLRGGELTTAGKISGLPLAWVELVADPQLAGAGLTNDLVFDGTWDAVLGDALRVKASLDRSSGDISVQAETAQGATTRVAAGVREARLSLDSNGDSLTLALRWNSERAGTADGRLTTRLTKLDRAGESGWTWAADAPLRGQLQAQLPRLGVWSVLAPPGWRLRGTFGAKVAITGTRTEPHFAGDLLANDLALRSVVDGIEFGNGRLRARLDGTRMRINEFTLQGAGVNGTGGTLTAQGEAAWLDGKPKVQLDATLQRLRASIRTDRQVTLSGNLRAAAEGNLTQFTGNLKVDQAAILLPDEGTPQLGGDVVVRGSSGTAAGQKAPAAAGSPQAAKSAGVIKVAVQIDLGQNLRIQGKGIDTRVRGSLLLAGDSLTEPRLSGDVHTFGGQYRAYGQRLDVEQGLLRFRGPIDNPALDILAVRPNLTQRVGVQITGTALLPRVRLYAQPELPDAEKLSWLVLGRGSASGGAEAALLQQAALALLGSKSGGSSGGLASSLGLDELSYRGSSNNANGTATEGAVTLGKRFSRNFYAAYERSISGALGTLFVFYDLSQRFTLRGQAGQQSAVDLIYTFPYD